MLYQLFRYFAFKLDPEFIHDFALFSFKTIPFLNLIFSGVNPREKRYRLSNGKMEWNFPVALAAGFDKEAEVMGFFGKLGFGAVEVGTVTPKGQSGNPKPRIFRLKNDRSLRNSMGFPNKGAQQVLKNIQRFNRKKNVVVGVNIGKNKLTPDDKAVEDYLYLYEYFYNDCDYQVINISSPNTPGLRDMHNEEILDRLLGSMATLRAKLGGTKPLYLKISPDLSESHIETVVRSAMKYKLSGIVATNTTIREDLGAGGVSGELLREKSRKVRKQVLDLARNNPEFDVIAAGGIDSFEDVLEFWKDGGKFVQIYTSFIYRGPGVLKEIKNGIDRLMTERQVDSLQELFEVGL